MSMRLEMRIRCPQCGKAQNVSYWASINVSLHPELKTEFFNGKLNVFPCEYCGFSFFSNTTVLYHDMDRHFWVWIHPKGEKPKDHPCCGCYGKDPSIDKMLDESAEKGSIIDIIRNSGLTLHYDRKFVYGYRNAQTIIRRLEDERFCNALRKQYPVEENSEFYSYAFDVCCKSDIKKEAEQGDPDAQFHTGAFFAAGYGGERDDNQAFEWFKAAGGLGHPGAQCMLGLCYAKGISVEQDYDEAAVWFGKAAEQGDAVAQVNYGNCFYYGFGAAKDFKKSAEWFEKAAEQGIEEAQYKLGLCYSNGEGVKKDHRLAVHWYGKAAEQGHPESQFVLSRCYALGRGVERNDSLVVEWLRSAAEQGHPQAQYNLGVCYYNGYGVSRDRFQAKKWLRKAAEQGITGSREKNRG